MQQEPPLEENQNAPPELPTPHIETPREHRRGLSLVWLVPLFAAGLAVWLTYHHYVDQGPLITLRFASAESIEAGVTRIKYKDMEIGHVTQIDLAADLSGVVVSARMLKDAEPWLTEHTRFWVVRPRVGLGGVSGLNTLVSGAYIQADVVREGAPARNFIGLETPPLTEGNAPGLRLTLQAENAGSVNIGSPVYFRQIEVGQVESREFSAAYHGVEFSVFIRAPHHKQITRKTRFWNISGIEASLNSEGIVLRTEALEALLIGGITFGDVDAGGSAEAVENGAVFALFDDEKAARGYTRRFTRRLTCVLYFRESVRGLKPGAPVEYLGVPVGRVKKVDLRYEESIDQAYIPVLIELESERLGGGRDQGAQIEQAVQSGLRAQLQTGNILTGQLFVALKVVPDQEPPVLLGKDPYLEIPTVATELNQITDKAYAAFDKLNALPLEALLESATGTVESARALLEARETKAVTKNVNQTLRQVRATLVTLTALSGQLEGSLSDARKVMGGVDPKSPLYYETTMTLRALQDATASIQELVEALERNPKALFLGE